MAEPEAVPVAPGAGAPGAGEQRPGTAGPWLPALAVGSSLTITHGWAGTLLQEVTAHLAPFVPFGTEHCHGMIKILSMK